MALARQPHRAEEEQAVGLGHQRRGRRRVGIRRGPAVEPHRHLARVGHTGLRHQPLFRPAAEPLVHHDGLHTIDQRAPRAVVAHVHIAQLAVGRPSVLVGALLQQALGRRVVGRGGQPRQGQGRAAGGQAQRRQGSTGEQQAASHGVRCGAWQAVGRVGEGVGGRKIHRGVPAACGIRHSAFGIRHSAAGWLANPGSARAG